MVRDDNGLFELFEIAPGCTEGYRGVHSEARCYIVGRGTTAERVYSFLSVSHAADYAAKHRLSFMVATMGDICATVVERLMGSPEWYEVGYVE